jgi:hypothetical protein
VFYCIVPYSTGDGCLITMNHFLSNSYKSCFRYLQDCGQTGTLLAGLLNAPQATFASKVDRGDDGSFTVERETDSGKDWHHARFDYFMKDKQFFSIHHLYLPEHRPLTYSFSSHLNLRN